MTRELYPFECCDNSALCSNIVDQSESESVVAEVCEGPNVSYECCS